MPLMARVKMLVEVGKVSLRQRTKYQTFSSALQAGFLRMSITHSGKKWKQKRKSIRLKGISGAITVRSSTSDFCVVRDVLENGEYAYVAQWALPPDAMIVDLGSNIGIASVYFATLCPRCRVVCVEPDAANFELLRQNTRGLAEAGRMETVQGFVSATDGEAGIDRSDDAWGITKTSVTSETQEKIPCYSLGGLLERVKVGAIDLLKCDIEGSEAELFKDCAAWIGRVRHIVIEIHPPYTLGEFLADLRRNGSDFRIDHDHEGYVFFLKNVTAKPA